MRSRDGFHRIASVDNLTEYVRQATGKAKKKAKISSNRVIRRSVKQNLKDFAFDAQQ